MRPPIRLFMALKKYIGVALVLILMVFFKSLSQAQESKSTINYEGKSIAQLKHAWTAQWITHPTESTSDARKFLFRRTFDIVVIPDSFEIYISADNRYRLYVNGQYITSGPATSDLNNYRYATIDIASYLREGKNVIAAEVVNFGEYKKVATMSFQTAFIVQGADGLPVDINTGRGSLWKVWNDEGFQTITFVSDSLRGYYAAGPGEQLLSDRHPWGWKEINYDDIGWKTPRLATVEFAVGRGFLYGSTWYLTPRNIPFMEERIERFPRIARIRGGSASTAFIDGTGQLNVPSHTSLSVLLDMSYHTIGHPELHYAQGKGSEIKITYAEALYDKEWKKGNRNDTAGKEILGYYDIVVPDGGAQRVFRPLGQKTFRYIQLDITTGDEALSIEDFYGVYVAYPFEEVAQFDVNDPVLEHIWDVSWRTLRNSAVEGFIDPYYEQLQYIGDTRIEAIVSISVSGDDRLMRNAIEMFDHSRIPCGLTASRYPAYIVQIIPTYSLLWINMIHDYYMYRDDEDFVKRFIPGMKTVLEWWMDKVDERGMPTGMEWWNFTDWAVGFHNGIPDGADDGYSTSIALQLVKTLQLAEEMFEDFGLEIEAGKYSKLEERIRRSVINQCYVAEKGLLAETPKKKRYSQHSNLMAILTNTIPEEQQYAMMELILSDTSLIQTTLYYKYYLFNALHKVGMGDRYSDLLGSWINQLELGLTTFAEKDIEPRSECHAWSASPNYHFLKIIAGIYPIAKGFKEIVVEPHFNGLTTLRALMPHPLGMVKVDLKRDGDEVRGTIDLPMNTTGIFKWHGMAIPLVEGSQQIGQ